MNVWQPQPLVLETGTLTNLRAAQAATMDDLRRVQAHTLDLFGFGVHECDHEIVASGPHWRLRRYSGPGNGIPLLMIPAPIKRPYIWDLAPTASIVRFCLDRGFDVHMVEWLPPANGDGSAGLSAYANAIVEAGETIGAGHADNLPFVIGHSLGGTLAAIACSLRPEVVRGLILLGAPLSFGPGSSPFRDVVVANRNGVAQFGTVAGSELSQSCALLSPGTFVWSRWVDGVLSLSDPAAFDTHVRIERWALDEVPLPCRLVHQIVERLYRENGFEAGTLDVAGRALGPSDMHLPVLAVVNDADEIGPRAAIEPFFARMPDADTEIVSQPAEIGVGLQHLAVLAGRRAQAETWPKIAQWIAGHA
ncbi:poly(3-hydroxyalkanoate) synthetase-like protein [Acuticoccus sediminis]|uniref:Poly(3-hydroxyalkanoate) synthetase-like protein n=1 Tax=Acuticoccus sediminis TaxID=2184697 RepID=A0A8B2P3V9_9HYPH|nr:alpha/beta fold hydrolase [Acuticoccus sediminis]RAI03812.1 poly(3-hydroxyalkanoate) synthetase-like protein [Acuticoccus sediminis]